MWAPLSAVPATLLRSRSRHSSFSQDNNHLPCSAGTPSLTLWFLSIIWDLRLPINIFILKLLPIQKMELLFPLTVLTVPEEWEVKLLLWSLNKSTWEPEVVLSCTVEHLTTYYLKEAKGTCIIIILPVHSFLKKCLPEDMFTDFRERERKGERKRGRKKHQWVASCIQSDRIEPATRSVTLSLEF